MPRGNRMGPMGMGPMTGRAAGHCAGFGAPGFANPAPGYGFGPGFGRGQGGLGRGFGSGRGWRNRFFAAGQPGYALPYHKPDPEMEKQALKEQAEYMQAELDSIRGRLEEIEQGSGK